MVAAGMVVMELVDWCFKPSQPQRIVSELVVMEGKFPRSVDSIKED